jgi:hypothetical protein
MPDRPGRRDRLLHRADLLGHPLEGLDAAREWAEELEEPFAEESAAGDGFFL